MQIDCSSRHEQNAPSPRIESREPEANDSSDKLSQWLKQHFEIVSIDEGMQIDGSDTQ
jgi:hypothetical protein